MIVVERHSDLAEATNGGIGKENGSRSVPGTTLTQTEFRVKTITRNLPDSLFEFVTANGDGQGKLRPFGLRDD
jgi:hypothetical protein